MRQLQQKLVASEESAATVETGMVAALASKNAEIDSLSSSVESFKRQTSMGEGKLARPCRLGFDVHPQIASCLSYHIKSAIVSLLAVIQCCLIVFHIVIFKKVGALSPPCNSFKFFLVNEKGDLLQTTVEAMRKNRDITETRMIQVYFLPLHLEYLMMLIITKVGHWIIHAPIKNNVEDTMKAIFFLLWFKNHNI
jgi:hypothetical protein